MRTLLMLLILLVSLPQEKPQQKHIIEVISINGAINPVVTDYIQEGINRAEEENAECLIIHLNTPGGLLKSTRMIVSSFFASEVPVVVYVYPSGSQAASAGVFITLAANIAVMSPGTNIGAAHPVMMSEGGDANRKDSLDIMMEKATNDAAAFMRSIAEKRNRNINWAEKAVRQSVSLTETEALKENVINFIAKNMDKLIAELDNREVETADGKKTIHTKGALIHVTEMSAVQKFLDIISDPNFAYILMMLGIYGLLFELYNPGSILPGIVGVIALILAFYSFHSLPVNVAGFALIIFSVILFIAEIKIVSHGLLAAGGIISFLIGSLMLINTNVPFAVIQISLSVIITVTALTALFFIFALGKGIAAQRLKPTTGSEGLVNETGIALSNFTAVANGQIMLHGEIWNAKSLDEEIKEGDEVFVVGRKDLMVTIKKTKSVVL